MSCAPSDCFAVNRFLYDALTGNRDHRNLSTVAEELHMTYGQLRDQLLRIHMPTCVAVLKRHAVLAHDLGDPRPV